MTSADLWSELAVLGRLFISLVLSAMMGWERERHRRPAGLRTHMLVGLSATLFVCIGEPMLELHADKVSFEALRYDPLRLVSAVIGGISFLGAGTIFVARDDRIRGLTTAASILATAAVGVAVALDRYTIAVGTSLLIVVVLGLVGRLEDRIHAGHSSGDA